MAILVGAVLAIGVGLSTAATGMDRDRALYPVMLLVIASYYALFAVMGGSGRALVIESIAICVFAPPQPAIPARRSDCGMRGSRCEQARAPGDCLGRAHSLEFAPPVPL